LKLLAEQGVDFSQTLNGGLTFAHLAGHVDVMQFLYERRAPLNQADQHRVTPLLDAARRAGRYVTHSSLRDQQINMMYFIRNHVRYSAGEIFDSYHLLHLAANYYKLPRNIMLHLCHILSSMFRLSQDVYINKILRIATMNSDHEVIKLAHSLGVGLSVIDLTTGDSAPEPVFSPPPEADITLGANHLTDLITGDSHLQQRASEEKEAQTPSPQNENADDGLDWLRNFEPESDDFFSSEIPETIEPMGPPVGSKRKL
jgi:hypothetical protein